MFPFSSNLLNFNRIILTLPGVLLAITLHEFAHGYTAFLLGDPTAKERGRLSLNPIAHIDPFGFIMLLVAGFGWAKPVPINPNYFKNRKMGTFLVSIAGPLTNVVLAIILTIILGFNIKFFEHELISKMLFYGIMINLVLAVFNLFPIPPLDGSKIVLTVLPKQMEYRYYQYQKYSYALLMILVFFRVVDKVLFPVVNFLMDILLNNILALFF